MSTIGRRVSSLDEITQPGDYFGPAAGWTGQLNDNVAEQYNAGDRDNGLPACFFLLPNAHDEGAPPGQRSIRHVTFPPHTYRECGDGSLEIRASIGAMPFWHGYLDEGHVWREC